MIHKDLLDIICCPDCKGDLAYNEPASTLTCTKCGHTFEVNDGIPVLLPTAAPAKNG